MRRHDLTIKMTETNTKTMTQTMTKTILETCDIWDTDYNSDYWEPEFMTIFLIWQLRETLDNIRNSCSDWVTEPLLISDLWTKFRLLEKFQIFGKDNDIKRTPLKSNPWDSWPETWHLRHWLHFWQLRTTIWTITLWPLNREWWWQHSQFLRCFYIFVENFCKGNKSIP